MDTYQIAGIPITLVRGDITREEVDAIVNAANSSLLGGGGVDGAIHRNGGPSILEECKQIREELYPDGLPTGEAIATTAGELPAKRVIHTVGPVWKGGDNDEPTLLSNAYKNSLSQARHEGLRSVAFPSISTGAYGYPITQAARIAINTVAAYLSAHPVFDEIRFALFSEEDLNVYRQTVTDYLEEMA